MEYENMRMPELKSLTREHRLRGYSRMRKAELVAFLTIWMKIILPCVGPKGLRYLLLHSLQRFIKPLDPQPLAQHLYIWGQYINQEKIKLQSNQV